MTHWLLELADLWWIWTLLCLPGAVFAFMAAELLFRYTRVLSAKLRYIVLLIVLAKFVIPPLFGITAPVGSSGISQNGGVAEFVLGDGSRIDAPPAESVSRKIPRTSEAGDAGASPDNLSGSIAARTSEAGAPSAIQWRHLSSRTILFLSFCTGITCILCWLCMKFGTFSADRAECAAG